MVPQDRTWILVLVSVNSVGETMPNYYVFKEKRSKQDFISLCEDGAYLGMQENEYMDSLNFSNWMTFF